MLTKQRKIRGEGKKSRSLGVETKM